MNMCRQQLTFPLLLFAVLFFFGASSGPCVAAGTAELLDFHSGRQDVPTPPPQGKGTAGQSCVGSINLEPASGLPGDPVVITVHIAEGAGLVGRVEITTPDGTANASSMGNGVYRYWWTISGWVTLRGKDQPIRFAARAKHADEFGAIPELCSGAATLRILPRLHVLISSEPASADVGDDVQFQNFIFAGSPPYTLTWDIAGEEFSYSTSDNSNIVLKRFSLPGPHPVLLIVEDSTGDVDSAAMTFHVEPDQLYLEIEGPTCVPVGQTGVWRARIIGTAETKDKQYDIRLNIDPNLVANHPLVRAGEWVSFEGEFETGQQTHTLRFVIEEFGGAQEEKGRRNWKVKVIEPINIINFQGPDSLQVGESGTWQVQFQGGSPPYTYAINWGDQYSQETFSSEQKLSKDHSYGVAKTYPITVSVTGACGTRDEATVSITVTGGLPNGADCEIPAGAILETFTDPTSHTYSEFYMLNGRKVGTNKQWWDLQKTQLRYEVCLDVDSRKIGVEKRWYESGQQEEETEYRNGFMHGSHTQWWENGQVWIQENYRESLRHGTYRSWDTNGNLIKECEFSDGDLIDCSVGSW